jgi:hypothetical protein
MPPRGDGAGVAAPNFQWFEHLAGVNKPADAMI